MITLLTLIPWVLTVAALLFIIVRQQQHNSPSENFLDDDIFDQDDMMMDHGQQAIIRVAVYEDKAYWVYQNVLYESEVTRVS